MAADLTTFEYAMKRRYTDKKVEDMTIGKCPFVANLAKNEDFSGESLTIPLIHGNPQGLGGTLAKAQANRTNSRGKKFLITVGDYDGSVEIEDKLIKASRSNKGAFLMARAVEFDGLYTSFGDDLNSYFWGNGGGSLGVIGDLPGGNVIQLATPSDAFRFEESMTIVLSDDDGTDPSHVLRTGSTFVTAVDRSAGTITVDDLGDLTGETVGDFIFRDGGFIGNTGNFVTHGVESYITPTDTPAAIYGMTRTSDPQRLAGCRLPAAVSAPLSLEDRIRKLASYMGGRFKAGGVTHGYLHPEKWEELSVELGARGTRPLNDDSTRFGFNTLTVVTSSGAVKIYADPYCPFASGFLFRQENWMRHSMGKLIHPVDEDGVTMLRNATNNAYEYRLVSYPALSNNAPGFSGRVSMV